MWAVFGCCQQVDVDRSMSKGRCGQCLDGHALTLLYIRRCMLQYYARMCFALLYILNPSSINCNYCTHTIIRIKSQ